MIFFSFPQIDTITEITNQVYLHVHYNQLNFEEFTSVSQHYRILRNSSFIAVLHRNSC